MLTSARLLAWAWTEIVKMSYMFRNVNFDFSLYCDVRQQKQKNNKLEGRSTKPSKLCLVFFAFVCVEALLGDMVGRGLII